MGVTSVSENVLMLDNVCKSYSGFDLRNVSFELPRGYIMGFVGPNGAGKTTTIRLIMNLARPDSGHITVLGQQMPANQIELKRRIGYVPENHEFYSDMTVEWTAHFVRRHYPTWNEERFRELLRRYDVDPRKKVGALSGTRAKLAMALALAHHPELLILDEPTRTGPCRQTRTPVRPVGSADGNRSVLFSTHITSDLERVADYITLIVNGQVAASDEREAMLERARASNPTASIEDLLWTYAKGGR